MAGEPGCVMTDTSRLCCCMTGRGLRADKEKIYERTGGAKLGKRPRKD